MKFSIIHFPRSWDPGHDEQVIDAIVEQSLQADALGFKAVFFPEHHFHGYSPTGSDPFQIAAYVAPQLKQAWIGMAVVVVPLHHPVHLAEQMDLLDHLTKGRVLFGVGSGIHAEEGIGFGLDYDYQIKTMTTENLEIAERLWERPAGGSTLPFRDARLFGLAARAHRAGALPQAPAEPDGRRRPGFQHPARGARGLAGFRLGLRRP